MKEKKDKTDNLHTIVVSIHHVIHKELAKRAERNKCSVSEEAVVALERAVMFGTLGESLNENRLKSVRGCVCPPTSEQTCKSKGCPRLH